MDPFVGVGFEFCGAVIFTSGSATPDTGRFGFSVAVIGGFAPFVRDTFIADIALGGVKPADGILSVGIFGTIDTAAGEETGQLGDGDAEQLFMEDVVDALLQVGDLRRKADQETFCDLAQKDAAFAGGVKEGGMGVAEQLLRKHIKHFVGHIGRGEDLIIGKVGKTGQDIGVIDGFQQRVTHGRQASCNL